MIGNIKSTISNTFLPTYRWLHRISLLSVLQQKMRWTKNKLVILNALLWFLTFVVILPIMAQQWVFSPFFYNSDNFRTRASKFVDKLNSDRYNRTAQYLKNINPKTNKDLHIKNLKTASMVAMIITKRRESCSGREFKCEPHYLQQVIAALDEDMNVFGSRNSDNIRNFVPIVICNVEKNFNEQLDFSLVRDQFPVILRFDNESSSGGSTNARSQETMDYAFCLESTLKLSAPKYLLVLEDDAVAFKGFFENIFYILDYRVERKISQNSISETERWGWIKLYYPELWSGFGLEKSKIMELISVAVFGAGCSYLTALALIRPKPYFSFTLPFSMVGATFLVLLVLVMSRQTFLEMRRLHSFFYRISSDLGCCTPAVLYSSKWIPEIVQYLRSSQCNRCHLGVDLALSDFSKQNHLPCHLVEPSLVRHIGMHSTLTSTKDPRSFLFYDFLYTEISNLIVGL